MEDHVVEGWTFVKPNHLTWTSIVGGVFGALSIAAWGGLAVVGITFMIRKFINRRKGYDSV